MLPKKMYPDRCPNNPGKECCTATDAECAAEGGKCIDISVTGVSEISSFENSDHTYSCSKLET